MNNNPEFQKRKSIRLKDFDYSREGLYFITICVHNHQCLFGKIENGIMILNELGIIANNFWLEIPDHYPNIELYEHILMPNHIHGIIEIVGTRHGVSISENTNNTVGTSLGVSISENTNNTVGTRHGVSNSENTNNTVGTRHGVSNSENTNNTVGTNHGVSISENTNNTVGTSHGMSLKVYQRQFAKPIPGSISSIINQYKSTVKRWCNKNRHKYFRWQSRFYDHIIRSADDYYNISNYIITNPAKWQEDKYYGK